MLYHKKYVATLETFLRKKAFFAKKVIDKGEGVGYKTHHRPRDGKD